MSRLRGIQLVRILLWISLFRQGTADDGNVTSCQNNESRFLPRFQYPIPWWVVQPSEVPLVANTALTLRSALTTSYEDFAQQILIAVAKNQTTEIAKSIGYMINANATLGGGCPVPPPPNSFLSRVGQGLGATVDFASNPESLWGEATEAEMGVPVGGFKRLNGSAVTDAVLAAMFVAGRSCGPPNALSSSTLAAIKQKYVDSVCYYAGPIFRSITDNNTVDIPCYNSTFEADIRLANQTDIYVSGPLLAAYKECIVGPPELLNPPSWLNYSFGPVVSIDSGGGANRVPSSGASIDNSSTASTGTTATPSNPTSGGGGGGVSLDGGRKRLSS